MSGKRVKNKKMEIKNKFNIGDIVYLVTDGDQKQRMITGINVRDAGIIYAISSGTEETNHFECEISKEINKLIKITNY